MDVPLLLPGPWSDATDATSQPSSRSDFPIAVICALAIEYDAMSLTVDHFWDQDGQKFGRASGDTNLYRNGRIGALNVVLTLLPSTGKAAFAASAANLRASYPKLQLVLLVGVCGGVPILHGRELLLGDVVISEAIVQYDFGKQYPHSFVPTASAGERIRKPSKDILSFITYFKTECGQKDLRQSAMRHLETLQSNAINNGYRPSFLWPGLANDKLFPATYRHIHRGQAICRVCAKDNDACEVALNSTCIELGCGGSELIYRQRLVDQEKASTKGVLCPQVFIGYIASGDTVMKSGEHRDRIAQQHNIIAFEMEGASAFEELPSIVIKGVCDYADSHKNKTWQPFAAATAAAVSKGMLERYAVPENQREDQQQCGAVPASRHANTAEVLARHMGPGLNSYWEALQKTVACIPEEARVSFRSTYDLYSYLFPRERIEGRTRTVSSIPPDLVATADSIASKLEKALHEVKSTLELETLPISLMRLTRGAVFKSLRFCLKTEAYFRPVANCMKVLTDYLIFLKDYAIEEFTTRPEIRSIFFNLYRCFWSIAYQIYIFFIDDFGKELRLSRESRWETRWKPVKNSILLIQSIIAADAAFALDLMRRKTESDTSKLDAMERERDRLMNHLAKMDEEAEKARLEDRSKILRWVCDLDYYAIHNELFNIHLQGTGQWLLERQEFLDWFHSNESSILWCYGSPGVGKTILCSVAQEHVVRTYKGMTGTGFAVAYCTYREPKSPVMYILSYLRQLLSLLPHAPPGIQEKYYELSQNARDLAQVDLELPDDPNVASPYTDIFTYVIERFKRVHLTFDAMDECADRTRWILPYLCRLVQRYRHNRSLGVDVKLFVTSRHQRDIEHAFKSVPTVQILAKNVDSDINTFIQHELRTRYQSGEIGKLHIHMRQHIIETLTSRAQGMFLWVKYQLDDICEQFTEEGIMMTLSQLPETLHGHYDRVINTIHSQSRPVRDMVMLLIRCIAGSLRRLGTSEMSAAIAMVGRRGESSFTQADSIDMKRLVNACHNIVVMHSDGSLGFAHYSVQEYLFSEYLRECTNKQLRQYCIDIDEARFQMTIACLKCLKNGRRGTNSYPLHPYASTQLIHHLQDASPERLACPELVKLFIDGFKPPDATFFGKKIETPIQLAARLGLYTLVEVLLRSNSYKDMSDLEQALRHSRGGQGRSYEKCQRLLLEKGVHLGVSSPRMDLKF